MQFQDRLAAAVVADGDRSDGLQTPDVGVDRLAMQTLAAGVIAG